MTGGQCVTAMVAAQQLQVFGSVSALVCTQAVYSC